MHKLYELKDMLCNELEEYSSKDLTSGNLDVIDKLSHAIKNIDKIIECYEEEDYSMARGGRRGGRSNARGGRRRDTQGRYSTERGYSMAGEDIAEDLRELMQEAPDHQTRTDIERIVKRLERM